MKSRKIWKKGLIRIWWRRQLPVSQDRYAMLAPLIAVALFLAVILLSFAYLRFEETQREREGIKRDLDYVAQQIYLRLRDHKEQLEQLAKDTARGRVDNAAFINQAESLLSSSPEILSLSWVNNALQVNAAYVVNSNASTSRSSGPSATSIQTQDTFEHSQKDWQAHYSLAYLSGDRRGLIQLQVPIILDKQADANTSSRFAGALVAEYSLDDLLRYAIPFDSAKKYAWSFTSSNKLRLAGAPLNATPRGQDDAPWGAWQSGRTAMIEQSIGFNFDDTDQDEPDTTLMLNARGYRTSQTFTGTGLIWLVSALSLTTIWMLWANWRHNRRRQKAQDALIAETNFRRAMENSMPTGMRALDMEGRITYVNSAFCQMTQWSESDLVGTMPPYIYWPLQDYEQLHHVMQRELTGNNNPSGTEMRVRRRDGSEFDARLYVSPLIDSYGQQTGWMASITDITEPKRVRDELGASYERFTTILEAIDASISVSSMGDKRILFANKIYRQWFGEAPQTQPEFVDTMLAQDSEGYGDDVDALAGLPTDSLEDSPSESNEVFVPNLDRWLEVRVRYVNWVDGHLAQMVIASDITARKHAEISAASQAERAQNASRLITMGEMASSVAHELNQPLAAIANYCNGITSRLASQQLSTEDLLGVIAKTNKQAQRAGQIIQRIRNFVKRSAPNRTPSDVADIVNDAIELAGLEVKRRHVSLGHYIAARLPVLSVDPILIEQVLINLIKNAAESIDEAQRPTGLRRIELKVTPKTITENEQSLRVVEFSVQDTGRGVPDHALERVFDAFFTTKSEGMGIGLNLCRSIVESHQGRLTAQNLYNGELVTGCRFSFWLPIDLSARPPTITALPLKV